MPRSCPNSLKRRGSAELKTACWLWSLPEDLQSEADQRSVELEFVFVQSSGEDMNTLKGMLEAGELKPHVSRIFPFENMADAHLQIESGRTVGKIIVTL